MNLILILELMLLMLLCYHVIKSDTLIYISNCIKLKSMIRKNVKSLKNIENNLYNIEKYSESIQIDLKS